MLTRRTAYELIANYPESTMLGFSLDETTGKYAAYCHLLDDNGEIHRLLVSTSPCFADQVAGVTFFNDLVTELQTRKDL
jgi:hypothetical protein